MDEFEYLHRQLIEAIDALAEYADQDDLKDEEKSKIKVAAARLRELAE